jgi:AcrR family transcriptional regulator
MAAMSSGQPRDRRVRRTRRLLQQSLLELLADEPLSKVTVSQIAARADVSRQAFYLHFSSKEELLLSHVDDVFDEIRATVLPSPARPRAIGLQELIAATFAEWARHAGALGLALQIQDKDQVIARMRVHVADVMDAFARYGREDVIAHPMHEYVVDFFTGGVYMLLRSWSRDGLATPSAQMAELTYSLLSSQISSRDTRPPGRTPAEAGRPARRQPALPGASRSG